MKKKFWLILIAFMIMVSISSLLPRTILGSNDSFTVVEAPLSLLNRVGVTNIPFGSVVIHFNTGITEVRTPDNKIVLRAKDSESRRVQLPKDLVSATYIYEVPSDSRINQEKDGRINVYKDSVRILTVMDHKLMGENFFQQNFDNGVLTISFYSLMQRAASSFLLKPPSQNNNENSFYLDDYYGRHVENAYDSDVDGLGYFHADWEVPSSPTSPNSATLIYLWNGVEPADYTDIAQPVIRYTQADGWQGLAVYGIDGNYFDSEEINVDEGDDISGSIWWDEYSQQWYIRLTNWDTLAYTEITTDDISISQNAAIFCALEASGVWTNGQMPGDTTFTNIIVDDTSWYGIDIAWTGFVHSGWQANLGGLNVNAVSDSLVELETNN